MGKKLTTDDFIMKAKAIHNYKYNYSLVDYTGNKTKVKIICPIHGEFEQRPDLHLSGKGCYKCGIIKKTTEDFISEAKLIHGDKYDYSLTKYINPTLKVTIICEKHGAFKQRSTDHLNGAGCSECGIENARLNKTKSTDSFIKSANLIHNNLYDYSIVNYQHWNTKIKIICKKHGEFEQIPSEHLKGHGCPICKESKGEKQIKMFLDENKILYIREQKFKNCKYKKQLPFDFYLPNYNMCIEYDGRQHYENIPHFGGEIRLLETQKRDKIKTEYCQNNNIKLIRVKHDDDVIEKLKAIL